LILSTATCKVAPRRVGRFVEPMWLSLIWMKLKSSAGTSSLRAEDR